MFLKKKSYLGFSRGNKSKNNNKNYKFLTQVSMLEFLFVFWYQPLDATRRSLKRLLSK